MAVTAVVAVAREGSAHAVVRIEEPSGIAEARRRAQTLAERGGLDARLAGRLAIGVTEAATNILKHAGRGEILLGDGGSPPGHGLEVLALDRGPGVGDLARSMADGYSTTGTAGTGLGAMRRLAREFEVYTSPRGVALRMWFGAPAPAPGGVVVGAVCVAKPGESASGDGWAVRLDADVVAVVLCDGLGHGPDAARAAHVGTRCFVAADPWPGPARWLTDAHGAMRATRGAAVGVAELAGSSVRFAGVGNVAAAVVHAQGTRHLVSHNGIVGHEVRKVQPFEQAFPADALLVLHSDGLSTRWSLGDYPGLAARHPSLVAAVLYRDHGRGRDDATVVVLRRGEAAGARVGR